jgi:hypothetical protein
MRNDVANNIGWILMRHYLIELCSLHVKILV